HQDPWLDLFQSLDQLDPGGIFQRYVNDGHIGFALRNGLQRSRRALCLAADHEIRLLVDQGGQPFAHQRMVVHQKDLLLLTEGTHASAGSVSSLTCGETGSAHFTSVPPVGLGSMEKEAPIIAARCAMMRVPNPWFVCQFSGKPAPSSSTSLTMFAASCDSGRVRAASFSSNTRPASAVPVKCWHSPSCRSRPMRRCSRSLTCRISFSRRSRSAISCVSATVRCWTRFS